MIHLSPPFHLDRSLPSKSTTASDGGPPMGPGSTTFGSSHLMPELYSFTPPEKTATCGATSPRVRSTKADRTKQGRKHRLEVFMEAPILRSRFNSLEAIRDCRPLQCNRWPRRRPTRLRWSGDRRQTSRVHNPWAR